MAAATVEYYFRFRICWCQCLQKVRVYLQTKFCRDISNGGWDIFLWQSKMAWEGVKLFSKSWMYQYPGMLCYILWIQNCIFDACRLSLHNSTPSHCHFQSYNIYVRILFYVWQLTINFVSVIPKKQRHSLITSDDTVIKSFISVLFFIVNSSDFSWVLFTGQASIA